MSPIEYLLQQTEGGAPALIHRPNPDIVDDETFGWLVESGVLEFRENLTSWDPCDGCECGATERAVRWTGEQAIAICPLDASSDTPLNPASLEVFAIVPERLARAVARAAGLSGSPESVLPTVWLLGRLSNDRSLLLATSAEGLHVAGAIDRLRILSREVNFTLIAAVRSAWEIADLADRKIDILLPSDAFLPAEPTRPIRMNLAKLSDPKLKAVPPQFRINQMGFTAEFHGKAVKLQPRDFRALVVLVREAIDGGAAARRDDLYRAVSGSEDAEASIGDEQVDKSINRIRQALCAAAGVARSEGRSIIVTIRGEGFRLNVPGPRIHVD